MLTTPAIVSVTLLLIVLLGFFTLSEYAIVSSRRSRLKEWANAGNRRAQIALGLSDEPDRFLATIRLGIILVGILIGVWGGTALVSSISELAEPIAVPGQFQEILSHGLGVMGLMLAAIVFGEILPRQIALSRPEWAACRVARLMLVLSTLATPVERLLGTLVHALLRGVGIHPTTEPPVTEEEIKVLLEEGTRAGVFDEVQQQLVERVFRYSDRRAKGLMTPRDQIVWIDMTDTPEEIRRKVMESPHSRFPVCDQSLDNLIGVVEAKHLLASKVAGDPPRVKGSLNLPLFLYEGTRGLRILEMFRKATTPMAIVLDEYGSVIGLLTLNDILQALVGDLYDRTDEELQEESMLAVDGARLLDGRLPLDEFALMFDRPEVPREDYETLAGFVVTRFGHIPQVGEHFAWQGLRFEVLKMVGNRVEKVSVASDPTNGGEGH